MSDEWIENILEAPELGSKNAQGKIYTGPKYGYQSWQTASSKRLLPSEALGSEPPKAAAKPEPQRGSTNAQGKFYTGKQYGYQSWQTASSKRLLPSEVLGSEPPKAAAPKPQVRSASTPRATPLPVIPSASTSKPAPAQTQRPPAPKPQAPAQTGDRTKDLTTWALANKGMIDKVGTKSQREILKAAQTGGSMPAPRPLKASLKDSYDYDAFDFVLEYLLSEGHTDTLEEALYVMMEMDPETIQSICEGYQELNYKRRNRMTDQAMSHMSKGDDKSWEKAYSIENQRDTQTPEVSKAKAAANRARGAAKRGKG